MTIDMLNERLPKDIREAFLFLENSFPGQVVFTTSLGKEDQIITRMVATCDKKIRVATLDTGRLFPETYDTLERTVNKYDLPIEIYYPEAEKLQEYTSTKGINAFYKSVELRKECCAIRKIEPLKRALAGAAIWVTGLRSEQSENRSELPRLQHDPLTGLIKFNPLVNWTEEMVDAYIDLYTIPTNPLHARGYPSIGCAPCTRAVSPGEHPRSGRWSWESSKKECGLHQHSTERKEAQNA